ncbi:toll/interleukin-1 receptor domain-containing protein [Sandarakinorhabdus sp.]|uniref:toll/interleukin-1 receptor domain-containing protein n=1 Tax=Sandarakinorhabdus sp. TaxID=1916663 RepID=UPI00286E965B|nr:toll/interleukin-1 receptor domain-containing protein [Sandarakinorhabdus sp.]
MVTSTPRYSVFLSYNRGDGKAAQRIQRWLETYRLPRRLRGGGAAFVDDGRRLRPVFRDIDEMRVAPDIDSAVIEAIGASAYLVVLCSPAAAKSEWVGREIEMFRARHGDDHILPLLLEGTPETSFPPALLHRADGRPLVPLAADIPGEGQRLALLKLVAVMAGVAMGVLVQRDAQRRMQQIIGLAALAIAVMAVVLVLVVQATNARLAEERQRVRAGTLSNYMLDDLRGQLKRAGRLDLLTAVNDGVAKSWRGQDLTGLSDADLQQRAKLLLAIAEDDESRGDLVAARVQTEEAMRTTAQLLAKAPADPARIFAHAQSQYFTGMVSWHGGERGKAAKAFAAYRDLASRLIAIDRSKPDWWLEVGYAENNLGTLTLRTRLDTTAAQGHFLAALKAFAAADALRPDHHDTLMSLADTEAWLADTQRLAGAPGQALAARARQKLILDRLTVLDPQDRQVTADRVAHELALARIAIEAGRPEAALPRLSEGKDKAATLAANDPQNIRRRAQVRMFSLMQLKALLMRPPVRRPDAATLAALNGDCAKDRATLKSDELADFCQILAARRTGTPPPPLAASGDRLTDRWGLDLATERNWATKAEEKAG